MTTLLNVGRYHLVNRLHYLVLPCVVLAFSFVVNLVIAALPWTGGTYSGGLIAIVIFLFVLGTTSVTRSLPFGFALGLSRRTYYLGTILLMLGCAAAYGLALASLQVVEGATGGWGIGLHFFRVPWFLDGPWYLTWLTSFVVLALSYLYGMWFGLVYRRWNVAGLVAFVVAQVLVLLALVVIATWIDAWNEVGRFFTTLSALGLTGVLVALVCLLTLGGFATIRRVTV